MVILNNMVGSTDIQEITGGVTLLSAVTLNIWEWVAKVPLNGWFVVATSIGGLVYLYWKIKTQKKASILKDLEIGREKLAYDRDLLEMEQLKNKSKK